jgi:hypothetical protein
MRSKLGLVAVALCAQVACSAQSDSMATKSEAPPPPGYADDAEQDGLGLRGSGKGGGGSAAPAASAPMEMEEAAFGKEMRNDMDVGGLVAAATDAAMEEKAAKRAPSDGKPDAEAEEPATRAWFPESLLWQPLVETNDDGVASVPVLVPDQLTTWRVLGLAHDGRGQQAGTELRFVGTLPVYVEPVMPGWLYAGDELRLPVQAVNTTSGSLTGELQLEASGAFSGSATTTMSLSPGGSAVRMMPLTVTGSGPARAKATLRVGKASDAAERVVQVIPTGKPVETTRGGTLTGTRSFALTSPEGADPATEQLEVLVFPGPLAVLQAELERLSGGPSDGAYAFAVATHLEALALAANVEVSPETLRRLRILAWQRVVRVARAPSPAEAADLLLGLRSVTGHELAEQRVGILSQKVIDGQLGDGSWSRSSTSTVQRVVVETALAGRVLPADALGPRLRAAGALERLLPQANDAYTAAVVLSSGLVTGETAAMLKQRVAEAVVEVDGQSTLPVPAGVVNAWGIRPSPAEMKAFGALALDGDVQGDLVSSLMQGWSASYGFGAGRADAVALDAIVAALPTSTELVTVTLSLDGEVVATSTLDPSQPKVPAVLAVSGQGKEGLTLTASPEVPGLAYVATRRSWVPWSASDRLPGVDVEVSVNANAVGREGTVMLTVSAPKGVSVTLEQGLPAGASVEGWPGHARVESWEARPDRFTLTTKAFGAGEIMEIPVPVTAAFAGRFHTSPLKVTAEGRSVLVRPAVWAVADIDG